MQVGKDIFPGPAEFERPRAAFGFSEKPLPLISKNLTVLAILTRVKVEHAQILQTLIQVEFSFRDRQNLNPQNVNPQVLYEPG
jgi:hypothetical protein